LAKEITYEEWFAELERLNKEAEVTEGLTVHEIHRMTGKCKSWIRDKLRILHDMGMLSTQKKRTTGMDGRAVTTTAYKPTKIKLRKEVKTPKSK